MAHAQHKDKIALDRLVFFSDAVFAIAITLLALEIRLPTEAGLLSDERLFASLIDLWPKVLGFVISFLVIGSFWMTHHRRFSQLTAYDNRLLLLNLILLMAVAFVPFPTAVLSESGNRTATIFYALVMALTGYLSAALWMYASSRRYVGEAVTNLRPGRRGILAVLTTPTIFLLSIGLAWVRPDLARLSWILIAPAVLVMR